LRFKEDTIEEIDEGSNSEVSIEAATKLAKIITKNFINNKNVEPKNETF